MINTVPSFTPENDTQTDRSRLQRLARRTVGVVALAAVVVYGASEVQDSYHEFSNMQFDLDGMLNNSTE